MNVSVVRLQYSERETHSPNLSAEKVCSRCYLVSTWNANRFHRRLFWSPVRDSRHSSFTR